MKQRNWNIIGLATWLFVLFTAFTHIAYPEDLRLASDGKSLEAVNVVTNTVSLERLKAIESETLKEISAHYEAIAKANQEIAIANAKLNDLRRYIATLEVLQKLRDSTNAPPKEATADSTKP